MTNEDFAVGVANLTAAVDRLALANEEVKNDLKAETQARNEKIKTLARQNKIILCLTAVVILLVGGLFFVGVQLRAASSDIRTTQLEGRKNGAVIRDCIDPKGTCRKEALAAAQKRDDDLIRRASLIARCASVAASEADYNSCVTKIITNTPPK